MAMADKYNFRDTSFVVPWHVKNILQKKIQVQINIK